MVKENLIGKTFNSLKVIGISESTSGYGTRRWICQCVCGKKRLSTTYNLKHNKNTSCGCNNPNRFQDLTGKKFGMLTVLQFSHKEGTGSGGVRYFWKCKCDCGKETIVRRGHLKDGRIRSCGCLLNKEGKESHNFKGYEGLTGAYYGSLKKGAFSRRFKFDVSLQYLWNLFIQQERKCKLTGRMLLFDKKSSSKQTASLDRIDSSKGYIEGNVQWIHKDINRMKNNFDQNYFLDICKEISDTIKSNEQPCGKVKVVE